MEVLRWVLAAVLALPAVLCTVGNLGGLVVARRAKRSVSVVPVLGGVFGTAAALVAPCGSLAARGAVAAVLVVVDPGSLWVVVTVLWSVVRPRRG